MSINLKKYKEEVEEIIKHSQCYPFDLNCEDMIEKWYENKKYFIDLFNGETRVQFNEDEFCLDETGKMNCFNDFVENLVSEGLNWQSYEAISAYAFLYINKGSFFDNKVSVIPESLKNQSKIRIGDKLNKSLKFFYRNKEELIRAQNLVSQYIQKNKVKGKLYLSVDPVDFLLASENNENWRSCHALDGEFRSGNLSYMCDSSTIIAFVSNGEKQTLAMLPDHMESYSKKLRVFVHWTQKSGVLYFSKTYPFDAPFLRFRIKSRINELYENKVSQGLMTEKDARKFGMPELVGFNRIELPFSNGNGRRYLDNSWLYYYGGIISAKEAIQVPVNALNYNDIINSSSYSPYVCFENDYWFYDDAAIKDVFNISIGESVPCARGCGNDIMDSSRFICHDCIQKINMKGDYYPHCFDCGRRIWPEDNIYYSECWGEEVTYCERCFCPRDDEDEDDDY